MEVTYLPESDSFLLIATRDEKDVIQAVLGSHNSESMVKAAQKHKDLPHNKKMEVLKDPQRIWHLGLAVHNDLWENMGEKE